MWPGVGRPVLQLATPAAIYARPEAGGRGMIGRGAILSLSMIGGATSRSRDWAALRHMLIMGGGRRLGARRILVRTEERALTREHACVVQSSLEGERYALHWRSRTPILRAFSRFAVASG